MQRIRSRVRVLSEPTRAGETRTRVSRVTYDETARVVETERKCYLCGTTHWPSSDSTIRVALPIGGSKESCRDKCDAIRPRPPPHGGEREAGGRNSAAGSPCRRALHKCIHSR